VDDEVAGGVTESKVVLGQLGLAGIESHLVTQQPALKKARISMAFLNISIKLVWLEFCGKRGAEEMRDNHD